MKAISQVVFLASIFALGLTATVRYAHSASTETIRTTVSGMVSCAHCQDIQPHKGFTPYSWACYSVSRGDDIILVSRDRAYKLQGDTNQLLKFMTSKATVTGRLEGAVLKVETIGRPSKNE